MKETSATKDESSSTERLSVRTLKIVQRHLDRKTRIEHCSEDTEFSSTFTRENEVPGSLTSSEWFTTEQAARYLGLSQAALRNLTTNGRVPYYKLGRRNRYRVPELRELLLSRKRGGIYGL